MSEVASTIASHQESSSFKSTGASYNYVIAEVCRCMSIFAEASTRIMQWPLRLIRIKVEKMALHCAFCIGLCGNYNSGTPAVLNGTTIAIYC